MPIDLTKVEREPPFAGDVQAELAALRARLATSQRAQIAHKRTMIVLVEGWVGSGKKAALTRMVGSWDPCHVRTATVRPQTALSGRHWLAPYWTELPKGGDTTIYYPSWYRTIVEQRLDGGLDGKAWGRACDEINEFEAQQRDHGTLLVKLFFHLTAERQAEVLRERQEDAWLRHLLSKGAARALSHRDELSGIINDVFKQTDTRWAPWRLIDGNDEMSASIAALGAMAEAMEKAMPAIPPVEGETVVAFRHSRASSPAA